MSTTEPPPRLWPFLTAQCVSAFALNWLWEMAQMRAYAEMARSPWAETLLPCTQAALGDVVITLAVFGVGALAAGSLCWGLVARWNVYVTGALLGGAWAVAYEWRALAVGRWSYTADMPVVPMLDVGLWPMLQLTLLVPAALGAAAWWARQH